jgi:peptidoglycan hydrolase-like protein with peptidoglycan-binding domain
MRSTDRANGRKPSGPIANVPHAVWFARWDGALTPNSDPCIPDTLWPNRRLKQYRGTHNETWNGVTLSIDTNCANGIVAPHAHGSVNCPAAVELDFGAYPTLAGGSSGDTVRALQFLLDKRGFGAGAADGVFGTRTEGAVRAFRQRVGLPDGGTADRPVWTALLSAGDDPTVQSGATGVAVKRLQRALTAALGRTVTVDGAFGPGTEQAVRDYQSSRGLTADGIAGPATWQALQQGR